MKTRYKVAFYAVAAVLLVFAVARYVDGEGNTASSGGSGVSHFNHETVRVKITEEPKVSRGQDPVLVQLIAGEIPDGVTEVTVLTDENCQPDAQGISHCHNRIQYTTSSGTSEAILQHHHRFSEEACLTPGQTLVLVG